MQKSGTKIGLRAANTRITHIRPSPLSLTHTQRNVLIIQTMNYCRASIFPQEDRGKEGASPANDLSLDYAGWSAGQTLI